MLKAQDGVITHWKKWLSISFILAFFHRAILIFYVAYLIGWIFEKQEIDRNKIILSAIILVILMILMQLLLPFPIFSVIDVQNLVGTMSNVEAYSIVKIFTLLLCLLTLLNKTRQQ
jgi:hypothetical protein